MGTNTKNLFKGISTLKGYEGRYNKMFKGEISLGNGCLMSITSLAILNDRKEIVEIDCSITNPHLIAINACYVYVETLRWLIEGKNKRYIFSHILDLCTEDEVRKTIEQAIELKERCSN